MKKRYIATILVIIFFGSSYLFERKIQPEKTLYLSSSFTNTQEAQKAFIKQKPVILWDLHDCLFEKPHFAWLRKGFWNIENKPKFFYEYTKSLFNRNAQKAIQCQRDKPSYVPQSYFEPIKDYKHLYTELNKFVNNVYTPNKAMFKIMKELNEEGCEQHLFSNIGPVSLAYLQHDWPQYFVYFTRLQNAINPVTPAQDQWIQKPEKRAFNKALMSVDKHKQPQCVIFIDDREDNIQLAQKAGMNGIVFVTPEQLKKDLNQLLEN